MAASKPTPLPTVEQLIAALSKQDPKAVVLISYPGHYALQTPNHLTIVKELQPVVQVVYGPLGANGNVPKSKYKSKPAVVLCIDKDRSQMAVHAFKSVNAVPVVPIKPTL